MRFKNVIKTLQQTCNNNIPWWITIPFQELIEDHFGVEVWREMGIISGSVSFRGRFGDHFTFGDHFGVGIISGAEQIKPFLAIKKDEIRWDKTWLALGKFLEEFIYLAVEICHRGTLPSATPSFQVGKNFEKQKTSKTPSAWVGQADFGKLELNNGNHRGNCQRLSAIRDQFERRSIWNNRRNFLTFAPSLWTDKATTSLFYY